MKGVKNKVKTDPGTEEKIKEAARNIFHRKGFAATRTRDIAEEAGINLALLNYYFRSKEKLFDLIMIETMKAFLEEMQGVFNNRETSFEVKVENIASKYIDLYIREPDIPLFILSELRHNPEELVLKLNLKETLLNSYFMKQFHEKKKKSPGRDIHPVNFIMNLMGMIIFPFVGSPLFKHLGSMSDKQFTALMNERKLLIPLWVKSMLK